MVAYEHAFDAMADPTRRAILSRLAKGPLSVGEIAAGFPVSRPAISQHLRALKDAGLVVDTRRGTKRVYEIDPDGLETMRAYFDRLWDTALAAFARNADGAPRRRPRGRR